MKKQNWKDLAENTHYIKTPKPCADHKPMSKVLGYLDHVGWVEKKLKRKAKQKQCPRCGRFYFKCEY